MEDGTEVTLYGLRACDSCRKARKALAAAGRGVRFRDVRAEPLTTEEIAALVAALGPAVVNRASATWRGLDAAARAADPATLLAEHPAVMKRPVIRARGDWHLGWGAEVRAA